MTNIGRRTFIFGSGVLLATVVLPLPAEAIPNISNDNGFPYIPKWNHGDDVHTYIVELMKRISNHWLYENPENNEITRVNYYNYLNNACNILKNHRFIYDYKAVCDKTNNSPIIINTEGILVDLYIKNIIPSNTVMYSVGDGDSMSIYRSNSRIFV